MFLTRHITAVLLVIGFAVELPAKDPIVPVAPGKLISHLPKTPPEWKLEKSVAHTEGGTWLLTVAERVFTHEIPVIDPETNQPTGEVIKQEAKVKVYDSGYHESVTSQMKNLEPLDTAAFKQGTIDGRPTSIGFQDTQMVLRSLVAERFYVEIKTNHLEKEDAEKWFGKININGLNNIPKAGQKELPQPLPIIVLNELDPSKSRQYLSARTTEDMIHSSNRAEVMRELKEGNITKEEAKKALRFLEEEKALLEEDDEDEDE